MLILYKAEKVKRSVAEQSTEDQRNGEVDISHIRWDNRVQKVYNVKVLLLSLNESEWKNYGTLHKRLTFEAIRS